ncbi:hypothetical protein AM588_10006067 [Phytophthora nicotianae]|uniref:Uncharacterized protein n=1 Tax=Phytophthora nicotianae TaxID=4792 RepID=A0A0W8D0I2_PHYNI|nr:hypothetical protein AM588_10006067 [Phytophthora nicotianae]
MRAPMKLALVMAVASATISSTAAFTFEDSKVAGESDSVGVVMPADVSLENKAMTKKKGLETGADTPAPTFAEDATQTVQQTESTDQTEQTAIKADTSLENTAVTAKKKGINTDATPAPTFSDDTSTETVQQTEVTPAPTDDTYTQETEPTPAPAKTPCPTLPQATPAATTPVAEETPAPLLLK